jgi:hypothetical protein
MFLASVQLIRALEREGKLLEPGAEVRVSLEEAQAMFSAGFAVPAGFVPERQARPIRGRFTKGSAR